MKEDRFRSARSVRAMFSDIAGRYDLMNRLLTLGMDERWRRRTARVMDLAPSGAVLDLCGGTGDLSFKVADLQRQVVCADFAGPMLELTKNKAIARDRDTVVVPVLADALRLPFPDGAFAGITIAFGLRNLRPAERGLVEMRRVLKPGGVLAVLESSSPTRPLLRRIHRLHLKRAVPALGRLLSTGSEAYDYLAESSLAWPSPQVLAGEISSAGFTDLRWDTFLFGSVALHTARV